MKKQIVKTISILGLLAVMSVNAVNVSASGGTCSVPSCRPKPSIVQNEERVEDRISKEKASTVQSDDSLSLVSFLEQLAMDFLALF